MRRNCLFFAFILSFAGPLSAADLPASIADAVSDSELYSGYFDFYYEANSGKLFLEVDNLDEEFLYASALATGLGSNDIGLDRGQLGGGRVVKFQRLGNKVFLKQINGLSRSIR